MRRQPLSPKLDPLLAGKKGPYPFFPLPPSEEWMQIDLNSIAAAEILKDPLAEIIRMGVILSGPHLRSSPPPYFKERLAISIKTQHLGYLQ